MMHGKTDALLRADQQSEDHRVTGSNRQEAGGDLTGSAEKQTNRGRGKQGLPEEAVKQFLDGVMAVATVQSVKYYGLFPASRLYRSFVLSSYSV
ncbi:hypothetical protein Tco_0528394 [Tanacetum coccineum]